LGTIHFPINIRNFNVYIKFDEVQQREDKMRNIIHLMKKEFIQALRDKKMIPIIFVMPILQLILLGYAANIDIKDVSVVLCDLDKSQMSFEFISQFTNSGYFTIEKSVDSPNDIDEYIDKGLVSVAIVLPNNFSRNILAKRPAQVQFISDGSDANAANIALGYAKQIVLKYSQLIMIENLSSGGKTISFPRLAPEPRVWFNPDLKSKNYHGFIINGNCQRKRDRNIGTTDCNAD
jgi:ABC-2 type transport system permease protein